MLKKTMARYGQMTEAYLQEQLSSYGVFPLLHDSMAYSLFAGGKRIRPVLCLAAAAMIAPGGEEAALPAAAAMEMIHTYSLIHDDLPAMDNDDFRRGKPSNHKQFGEANAILAGDGLLTGAFLLLAKASKPAVAETIAVGAMDMVAGQSLDLNPVPELSPLYRIHALKTGALIKASVLSGALSVGADSDALRALSAFAEHYGLLFQITDDILDVTGDAKELGKSVGKDEKENKVTFVSCFGLQEARLKAKEEANEAKQALSAFGDRAGFFNALVDMTQTRTH